MGRLSPQERPPVVCHASLVRLRGLLIDLPRRGVPFLQRSGSLSRQRPAPVELKQFGGKVEQRGPREGDDPYPLHDASLATALWCTAKSFAIDRVLILAPPRESGRSRDG